MRNAWNEYGLPPSVLSDNGAVFTARMRNGREAFQTKMASLKVVQKLTSLLFRNGGRGCINDWWGCLRRYVLYLKTFASKL